MSALRLPAAPPAGTGSGSRAATTVTRTFFAAAGSGLATLGIPSSPGVPAGAAADTLACPFNDAR